MSVLRKIAARLRRQPQPVVETASSQAWPAFLDRPGSGWPQARAQARSGPDVLIATAVGGLSALSLVESVLAVARELMQ